MSVKIWIGSEYENTGEIGMVADVLRALREALAPLADQCHILCNFSVPGYPAKHKYRSSLDMAVLRKRQLVILELKNYKGGISCEADGVWYCDGGGGHLIEVKGGREGRTPVRQVCEYRDQVVSLLMKNSPRFLSQHGRGFDFKKFVSGVLVFPVAEAGVVDRLPNLGVDCDRWLKVRRLNGLAEAVCQFAGGRGASLSDSEMENLIRRGLGLSLAQMVGNCPMIASASMAPSSVATKIITVHVPVKETRVEEVREEYGAIASVWNSDDSDLDKARQFAKLFKRFVWNKIRETYKDTAVQSVASGIINLFCGDTELLDHANRLRRLSVGLEKETIVVTHADVVESFKTLCLVVRKLYGQEMPEMLAESCNKIVYRGAAKYEEGRPNAPMSIYAEVKEIDSQNKLLHCINLDSPSEEDLVVKYAADVEFADLDGYVLPGDRVCLVTPMKDGECYKASEIVLEPDYLVPPQKMGSVIEYAHPAVYFWLSLFEDKAAQSRKMEQYTIRGNFSNDCLAAFCAEDNRDVNVRMVEFFQRNSLHLTAANLQEEWMKECCAQDKNLKRFIGETIPREHHVQPEEWQIEAPLYSPVYGLSARADAIAYGKDGATVLELKSGKWDNFKGDHPQKEHIVQPLFYGDLLYFSRGIRRDHVNQLLCYAKTLPADSWNKQKDGKLFTRAELAVLVPGHTASHAVKHFSKVRNGIVSIGSRIRKGEFRKIVESLNADDFRTKEMSDAFWNKYKRPDIEKLLAVFQNADELSKRYVYRMMSFVAEEDFLARLGERGADIGRGGSSSGWRLSAADRQKAGSRLSGLIVISKEEDAWGRVTKIELDTFKCPKNKGCSIRAGDSVCLFRSSQSRNDNVTNSIVFACDVLKIQPKKIVLELSNPQKSALFGFGDGIEFVIEPVPSSGMSSGYSGLRYFLTGDARRRKLVLNEALPEKVDQEAPLPMFERELDRRYPLISNVLKDAWRAKDWYLIWGPPGTGKTSHAMRGLVDLAMATPGMRILLLAYTYRATDEICRMLESRLSVAGQANDIYLRLGNSLKCDSEFRDRMVENISFKNRLECKERLDKIRIVVAPVAAVSPDKPIFGLFGHFDLAIVDEASQLLDTHILPLFCATDSKDKQPIIRKFIFIGDDRQLPAVVQQSCKTSKIEDYELNHRGILDCRHSFFQRLKVLADNHSDLKLCGLLNHQFRMHPEIAAFCNHFFYEDKLIDGDGNQPQLHQTVDLPPIPDGVTHFERYVLSTRLGFFPVVNDTRDGDSKVNEAEIKTCASIVKTLRNHLAYREGTTDRPYELGEIGIVVPFRNQIAEMSIRLAEEFGDEESDKVLVDTVERFQGSERKVIIFSTVIQKLYQSELLSARRYDEDDGDGDPDSDPVNQKLNVAVTRAKERFYLVGNETVLRGLRAYGDLLKWISERAGFFLSDIPF